MIKLSRRELIEEFWDWFNGHKYYYQDFDSEWDPGLEQLYEKLELIDETITLQILIEAREDGERNIIISADGNIDHFPLVREIVDAAPEMMGWKATALQQPQEEGYIIQYKRFKLVPSEMYFIPHLENDYFNVAIYGKKLKRLSSDDSFYLAIQIMMSIIGEYHFATKVTACYLDDLREADEQSLLPLTVLYQFVVNNFMNRN